MYGWPQANNNDSSLIYQVIIDGLISYALHKIGQNAGFGLSTFWYSVTLK